MHGIFCGCCFSCNSGIAAAIASLSATRLLARANEVQSAVGAKMCLLGRWADAREFACPIPRLASDKSVFT
jgi:hypothetical protein